MTIMNTTIRIALLLALISCLAPVGAQGYVQLRCSPLPDLWTSPTIEAPESVSSFELDIQGPRGSWIQVIPTANVAAGVTGISVPSFIKEVAPRALSTIIAQDPVIWASNPNDLNPPAWIADPALVTTFYKFSVANLGNLSQYSSVAVQDWCAPLRYGVSPRVWSAQPPIWVASQAGVGLGYGIANSNWWRSCLTDASTSNENWSAMLMLRHAIILQSMLSGQGNAGANAFFDSDEYKQLLVDDHLQLNIQAFAMIDPSIDPESHGPYGSDFDVPPLPSLPGPAPLTTNSNPITLTPVMLSPVTGGNLLAGSHAPGEVVYLTMAFGVQPITFTWNHVSGGTVSASATSASMRGLPARYRVVIPHGITTGNITLTTGRITTPIVIGQQVYQPVP